MVLLVVVVTVQLLQQDHLVIFRWALLQLHTSSSICMLRNLVILLTITFLNRPLLLDSCCGQEHREYRHRHRTQ